MYKDLWETLDKMYKNYSMQSKIVSENLDKRSFYDTLQTNALWELFNERNNHSATYLKVEQALLKKKEKLFKQDISRWELKPEHYAWKLEFMQDF